MGAYDAALPQVAARIAQEADDNGDGRCDDVELVRGIHDYLCQTLYYDTAAYESYQQTGDYRIFCSAGAILPGTVGSGVVCEGYAKGFKVLCDQLGIPCVLIGGTVVQNNVREGHMWNGVQIGGRWYLVDATWDDIKSIPSPTSISWRAIRSVTGYPPETSADQIRAVPPFLPILTWKPRGSVTATRWPISMRRWKPRRLPAPRKAIPYTSAAPAALPTKRRCRR